MKAAVFLGDGRLEVREVPAPEPGPGQVRVRLEGGGVCASNLPVWEGRTWFQYPLQPGAPGHEGWGRVDAVGREVRHLRLGERVAMLSARAYAEYDVASADAIVPLPEELRLRPFPGEPLGCAVNVFRRSEIRTGHTVAVIGLGFLGALLTRLASDAGARVLALARRPYALALAREFGAAETVIMDDHWKVIERVREWTGGEFCDRVIECTGHPWPLDLAGELTRVRGKLVVAGYHQEGLRQINMQLWNWRGLDVINAHERDTEVYVNGIREAVRQVASGKLDPTPLYTHTFELEEIQAAFETLHRRPDGFVKALVSL
ncbi:MAG: L-iditol 2-dehydrogenase [Candidatus Zixiibacteriota bacterium]|nr:MAG: L-iditol 2-dehydrogenase [candidate division Zixibacteria bacterium]